MKFVGIAHTAYAVGDMKKSLEFYVGKLGFTHAFSLTREDGTPWIEYLNVAPGQFIELFYADKPLGKNSTYRHLCLRVEDCAAAAVELAANGVEIDVQPKQGTDKNIQCWIHDPDGNPVEIMQIAPESPQAKFD